MTTKQENDLLKIINNLTKNTEKSFYYDSFDSSIHLSDDDSISIPCKKLSSEIYGILQSLSNKEYVLALPQDEYCIMNPVYYRLTHKGLHRFQFQLHKLAGFLIRSIATPIIVSAATSLVVLWLRGLLKLT